MKPSMANIVVLVLGLAIALAACGHASSRALDSNFQSIKLVENRIVKATDGVQFTGTLVAREAEITEVARAILEGSAFADVSDHDTRGLVLVIPIKDGIPDGKATVYVDLRAPTLGTAVKDHLDANLLELARTFSPTIPVVEATFEDGKLEGPVIAYSPSAEGRGTTKLGEVTFVANVPHGDAIEYYPGTRQPRRRYHYEHGTQTGPQQWFHANGKPERTATFVAGDPHGEMLELYANGAKRARTTYEHGKPSGTQEAWFPNGKLRRQVTVDGDTYVAREWYSNGTLASEVSPEAGTINHPADGVIETYHRDGTVQTRTTYVDGVQHGPFEAFYADGKKHEAGSFTAGKQTGVYQVWWKNGTLAVEARFSAGERDGTYKRTYANGKPWEVATYVRGKLDGDYRKWWKNGKPAHVYAYKLGKLVGDYRTFYDNGAKWAVGRYEDGKPQGTLERYFPDGKLGYVMHHEDGRPHGPYRRWYADGAPRLEATYHRGSLHGVFENWLEDGSVYELATFERGAKVRTSRATPSTSR